MLTQYWQLRLRIWILFIFLKKESEAVYSVFICIHEDEDEDRKYYMDKSLDIDGKIKVKMIEAIICYAKIVVGCLFLCQH